PHTLLTHITQRATHVWQHQPHRPAPPQDTAPAHPESPSAVPPRRLLLKAGTGTLAAAALTGAGIWTWLNTSSKGNGNKPAGGPAPDVSPAKKGDWLWRVPLNTSKSVPQPPRPLSFVASVAVSDADGVRVLDMNRGGVEIPSLGKAPMHRCASDEERLYTSEAPSSGAGPLTIKVTDLVSRDLTARSTELKDCNGALPGTQLLCGQEGVVYIAAGQGKPTGGALGFGPDQKWFLMAVDTQTGKTVWRRPLPSRPVASQRLHFLAARVIDHEETYHLVLLRESPQGKVTLAVHDARTGKLRWEQPLEVTDPDDVQGLLEVDLVHVYPPTGPLRALALKDGREVWSYGVGRSRGRTGPPVIGDSLFAVEEGTGLVALDWVTGDLVWRETGGQSTDADLTIPPVTGYRGVYSYDRKAGLMKVVDVATGKVARTYKAQGDRFYAHMGIPERLIAVGRDFIAGYEIA
ncbi:outer membrane protein assembly factor BamB family protein, partial [Streptomyces xantholiticus]|uniref:outer membrane protein assembly factor BamB family protein n=1 Tax=Streptomyces xantholiticus TaxID=68285 RepID=UPI001E48BC4A